jgi:phosphatidate cytidylyltransferase
MKLRAITGFFFIIVMLGSLLLGHYVFDIFYSLLSGLCLWEFCINVKKSGINLDWKTMGPRGIVIYIICALQPHGYNSLLSILLVIFLIIIFIEELFKKNEKPFTIVAYAFLGVFFTIVPFLFFHALGYMGEGFNFHLPMAFLLMLWANDTGAYLVGSKLGKHKLFERHSPKKTWEGFIGGILITAGAALLIARYFTDLSQIQWVVIAVLISVFGTIGDLIESMFKRSINVKDSGGLLPGHGGLLDRFDGLFIAAPVVYIYLYFATYL